MAARVLPFPAVSEDTAVYIKYTQTGTAATTGAAVVIVFYVPQSET